jgi:hypothetical protein
LNKLIYVFSSLMGSVRVRSVEVDEPVLTVRQVTGVTLMSDAKVSGPASHYFGVSVWILDSHF